MQLSSRPVPGRRAAAVTVAVFGSLLAGPGVAGAAGSFDVAAYDVTIGYQPGDETLHGSAVITASATTTLDRLTLHLAGPDAGAVVVDGVAAKSFGRGGESDLDITPPKPIARGADFHVRVDYAGKPGAGWLRTEWGGATAFQGASAAWFPVGDGQDKADFHLTGTAPAGWSVVSVGRELPASGKNTFRWAEPDVSPDSLAVSIDRFAIERTKLADGTPVVNAYAPGLREKTKPLADRLPEIIDFLSGHYGSYPFDAAGNVFVQVNDDGPGTAPQSRPVYLGAGNSEYMDLTAVVHEQAHQWYGVSTAPRLPEDTCLSECFATYTTWMWDEAKNGADLDDRYRDTIEAKKADPAYWQSPLYQPGATPGFQVYERGPLALHALRRQIGDRAFGTLLAKWPRLYRGVTASWPQFEQLATQLSGQDLSGFFQAWFRGTTVPPDQYLWPGTAHP